MLTIYLRKKTLFTWTKAWNPSKRRDKSKRIILSLKICFTTTNLNKRWTRSRFFFISFGFLSIVKKRILFVLKIDVHFPSIVRFLREGSFSKIVRLLITFV